MTVDEPTASASARDVKVAGLHIRIGRAIFVLTAASARLVPGVLGAAHCGRLANTLAAVMDVAHPRRQERGGSRPTVTYAPNPASRPIPPAGAVITVADVPSAKSRAPVGSRNVGIVVDLEEFFYTIYNHVSIRSQRRAL
jgi:hypothetical protein